MELCNPPYTYIFGDVFPHFIKEFGYLGGILCLLLRQSAFGVLFFSAAMAVRHNFRHKNGIVSDVAWPIIAGLFLMGALTLFGFFDIVFISNYSLLEKQPYGFILFGPAIVLLIAAVMLTWRVANKVFVKKSWLDVAAESETIAAIRKKNDETMMLVREQHADELKKLQAKLEAAHAKKVAEKIREAQVNLDRQHASDIEELKTSMKTSNAVEIKALQAQHADELNKRRIEFTQIVEQLTDELKKAQDALPRDTIDIIQLLYVRLSELQDLAHTEEGNKKLRMLHKYLTLSLEDAGTLIPDAPQTSAAKKIAEDMRTAKMADQAIREIGSLENDDLRDQAHGLIIRRVQEREDN